MSGVLAQAIVLLIGVPIGAISGYFGGATDNVLMRLVDVIYAIPQLLMVLLFVNWWGPGLLNIFLAIGLVGWVTEARLVRGQFLSLREQEYVSAAQVAGGNGSYIIRKHMLPNSLTPIIVALTFGIPTAIFTEAALSFVGVGIRPPQASWGQMVAEGSNPGTSRPIRTCFSSRCWRSGSRCWASPSSATVSVTRSIRRGAKTNDTPHSRVGTSRDMGAAFTPNTRQPSRRRSGRVESSGERRAADARLAPETGAATRPPASA